MITIKTLYIEKLDKPKVFINNLKIEQDNLKIYADLEKERNLKKVVKKIQKLKATNVVLSKELEKNVGLINILNANGIKIFDGKWLEKYLSFEILDFVLEQKNMKKEEIELAITTNEITDFSIETIKKLAREYKRLTVVTKHIDKLRKIEKEIYDKDGILIVISNNLKKSLTKAPIILNMDFNKEVLNKYKINENAVIINLEGDGVIYNKRFNGLNINNYEILVGKEDDIWRENLKSFSTRNLLEAELYRRDTFSNIRQIILKSKVSIKELYGINGKIERFY